MAYTSCRWLEHGISFNTDHTEMCCLRCHKGGGRITLQNDFTPEKCDWDNILKIKNEYIENAKNGILPKECEGCFELCRKNWKKDQYIDTIHFDYWTKCNCNCIYCYTSTDKQSYNTFESYKILPVIEDLFRKNLFKPTGEITFAGGEPTLLDEFDDLIGLFLEKGTKLKIHSSGLKYSEALAKGIEKGQITLVLSSDSGTKEMYQKIKQVEGFDIFWENAKRYAEHQPKDNKHLVATKYILIPELNTKKSEINKWFNLNKKAGIKCVAGDVEDNECAKLRNENKNFPRYLYNLSKYIVNKADDLGFHFLFYNNFWYLYHNTQAKRDLFLK